MTYPSITRMVLPIQVIAIVASLLKAKGIQARDILEGTGLKDRDLEEQNTFIHYDQLVKILSNAQRLYPKPGLWLEVGARESLSAWGLLGFAMLSAANLRDALRVARDYYLVGPALSDMEFIFGDEEGEIRAIAPVPLGDLLPAICEELFATANAVFPVLIGKPFQIKEIHLTYDKPEYAQLYQRVFNCPIHFNSTKNSLVFNSHYFDCKVITADPLSAKLGIELCKKSIVKQGKVDDLRDNIRRVFLRSPGFFPSMELVAEELNMSVRTMRRHLADLETTYQNLADDFRRQLAMDYLHNKALTLEQIAELVGFSEYNNFRKAFKRWTGHPPTYYRNNEHND